MATKILNTAAGDGELKVEIDELGNFGSAVSSGGEAFYDPLGAKTSASTTFRSYVALGIIGSNGTTGARTELNPSASPNEVFTNANSNTANSTFTVGGLQFQLKQTTGDLLNSSRVRTGSRFDQAYTVTNTTNAAINFDLVRYVDGDLLFDGSLVDGGGKFAQGGQDILFETDSGGTGQTDTTFFGITGNGGTIPTTNRFELDGYSQLSRNVLAGTALRNTIVQGDSNSDGFIDARAEYDVALGLRNVFSLAPGASTTYVSTTRFGTGDLTQLDITAPTGGLTSLPSTTVGTNVTLVGNFPDPSGLRNYDSFVSTNNGAFTQFVTDATDLTQVFTGAIGNSYTFYSLATDNAGNEQIAADVPRTTTRLVSEAPAGTPITPITAAPGLVQLNPGTSTSPTTSLLFSKISHQAVNRNELGVFVVDDNNGTVNGVTPGQTGYLAEVLKRSQVVFSALSNSTVDTRLDPLSTRNINLAANAKLGFYLVENDSSENLSATSTNVIFSVPSAGNNFQNSRVTQNGQGIQVAFEDTKGGGDRDFNDLVITIDNVTAAAPLGSNLQGSKELFDLRTVAATATVGATFTVTRDAGFNDRIGFYKVEDAQGSIRSGTTLIRPGDAGYRAAAIQGRITGIDLVGANGQATTSNSSLAGGSIYAPLLISDAATANADFSNVYTAYRLGNADGVDHIRLLADNTFGFEDVRGGGDRDFNDLIVKATFATALA
jgi:Domain of unknown function (DUF4114)